MKNHFPNWFSFARKSVQKWKNTKKRGNQFKKWNITFQTDFHLFKKGEIRIKSKKTQKKREIRLKIKNHFSNWFSFIQKRENQFKSEKH